MRLNGTVRGLLILAAVAGVIVVLQLWTTLAVLVLLARIAFFLAIAFFVYLMWRERREECEACIFMASPPSGPQPCRRARVRRGWLWWGCR